MWRISNQFLIFKSTLLFHSYKKLNHSGSGIKDILSGISGVETAPLPTSREEVIWLPLTWNRRVDGTEERTQLVVMVALSLSGASPFCYKWQPCPGWCDSVGWVSSCKTKGHWWFQVRAHAWVVGSVPGQGSCGGGGRQIDVSHIDASLPLFFPPFPSKKKWRPPVLFSVHCLAAFCLWLFENFCQSCPVICGQISTFSSTFWGSPEYGGQLSWQPHLWNFGQWVWESQTSSSTGRLIGF